MTEGLFVLTTMFVAYVIREVLKDQRNQSEYCAQEPTESSPASASPVQETPTAVPEAAATLSPQPSQTTAAATVSKPVSESSTETKSAQPVAEAKKPDAATGKAKSSTSKKPAAAGKGKKAAAGKSKAAGLKNPKTGEVATNYSNYYFAKRWIKDALVKEGLLEKVYKNTEVDDATDALIKEAIAKLEAMDKYKP